MKWILESKYWNDYVIELPETDFSHPLVRTVTSELFSDIQTDVEKAETAFIFVRDQISHSFDIQGSHVTCKASEVLQFKEGICYAKTNLLAALLRSQGIPTGFCYQRLVLFEKPEDGYSIHALNAIYLASLQKWIRVDARGNKPGVNAQFSTEKEQLAFPIREADGEYDDPVIYAKPHPKTTATLTAHDHPMVMYKHHLPDRLDNKDYF
ncbi:transglutaminase-like domain-containing protein [Gracilibacillus alcaliphilus]|uniref:transglutaminase-like domain-containing protein n=1 Tax=Gracilibacillus alcaliphilus TaxID=1401441 RepID=UPI00195BBB57|nr:transglutaminase family protein [Gracilibacillus alcaliphilus]MBM7676302.1 transglutaminase-like putative cysteine protease [Gracilibacillus alcaliphilus]